MTGFTLLPPAAGVCQQCAVDHEPNEPHDAESLRYQFWFYGQHERWPTWADAMAHCTAEIRAVTTAVLAEHGDTVTAPE